MVFALKGFRSVFSIYSMTLHDFHTVTECLLILMEQNITPMFCALARDEIYCW